MAKTRTDPLMLDFIHIPHLELYLCYSIVYHYNGSQWYEHFLPRSIDYIGL